MNLVAKNDANLEYCASSDCGLELEPEDVYHFGEHTVCLDCLIALGAEVRKEYEELNPPKIKPEVWH